MGNHDFHEAGYSHIYPLLGVLALYLTRASPRLHFGLGSESEGLPLLYSGCQQLNAKPEMCDARLHHRRLRADQPIGF